MTNIAQYLGTPANPAQEFVKYALGIGAIELIPEGRALKSGRISPYFFNSGLFNTGTSIDHLAEAYAHALDAPFGPEVEVIFGPAYKGIPLSVAIAMRYATLSGYDVGYAFNRKEEKDHGEGGTTVGASLKGKKVLIVDDVMTTGTSSGEAVEIIKKNGGVPIGCVIAFNRQERGAKSSLSAVQEFEQNYGIPVYSAASLSDLIKMLEISIDSFGEGPFDDIFEKVSAYRNEYGVT